MKKTVVLIEPTIRPVGVEYLQNNFNVVLASNGSEETLIDAIQANQASAVIVRVEHITRKIIEQCPSLEVIGMHGVGLDTIDVQAATENGVMVLNAPFSNYVSVAEHAIMSILALSRSLRTSDLKVRSGEWHYREVYYPMEVNFKTLMIVGMGKIGQELAKKAKAFNMQVLGFDPFVSASDMKLYGVTKVDDLDAAIPACDFISLHAPLTKGTHHLFSAKQFGLMKPTAYIVNLGRGPLIDQAALYEALKNNKIAGAGLDVLEQEPPNQDDPFLALDNVIFTPHFGGDTLEAKDRCSESITLEVGKALRGNMPSSLVNPKVLANARAFK
ncbi:hydroxyacid dehydrogenase [Brevibacillus sp. B_LB10_24]|uniref:hydroxyacid dehydrogenase n=1 Tax=Brevibacillus sp. B_LB10_24 TaxID=3380645 RepID=UPI0038B9ED78